MVLPSRSLLGSRSGHSLVARISRREFSRSRLLIFASAVEPRSTDVGPVVPGPSQPRRQLSSPRRAPTSQRAGWPASGLAARTFSSAISLPSDSGRTMALPRLGIAVPGPHGHAHGSSATSRPAKFDKRRDTLGKFGRRGRPGSSLLLPALLPASLVCCRWLVLFPLGGQKKRLVTYGNSSRSATRRVGARADHS